MFTLVILVVGFEMLSIKEMQSSQVLVSDAYVVVIVLQSSARFTFAVFVILVDGFAIFVIAMLSVAMV